MDDIRQGEPIQRDARSVNKRAVGQLLLELMEPGHSRVVGVLDGALSPGLWRLFTSLAQLYPVEFRHWRPGEQDGLVALIVVEPSPGTSSLATRADLPTLVSPAPGRDAARCHSQEVEFSKSPQLDPCLRGRGMVDSESRSSCVLQMRQGDELLASRDGQPIWLRRRTNKGQVDFVALALPELEAGEGVREHFRSGRCMGLLPLLCFLRALTQEVDWQPGPVPACLVFDDPSLYSTLYGFLDYRELAAHAQAHSYCVSVAIIPLDCWRLDSRALAIFRSHSPRLSLVLHGNSHIKNELAQSRPPEDCLRLLAQALRRYSSVRQNEGLEACLVMEAPHGAVTTENLAQMVALGYAAVLGTPERLFRCNAGANLPKTLGMDYADLLGGLPVIPRIRMSPGWGTDVLLAAFLRQPIVLACHHWDLAAGYDLPWAFADLVNGLTGTRWASPSAIVNSSFKLLRTGELLHLKMYSRRVCVSVPDDVRMLAVYRHWIGQDEPGEPLAVSACGQLRFSAAAAPRVVGPISVTPGEMIEITSPPKNPVDYRRVRTPRPQCWPVVRKVFMEVRDRTAPGRLRARNLFQRSWSRMVSANLKRS